MAMALFKLDTKDTLFPQSDGAHSRTEYGPAKIRGLHHGLQCPQPKGPDELSFPECLLIGSLVTPYLWISPFASPAENPPSTKLRVMATNPNCSK